MEKIVAHKCPKQTQAKAEGKDGWDAIYVAQELEVIITIDAIVEEEDR